MKTSNDKKRKTSIRNKILIPSACIIVALCIALGTVLYVSFRRGMVAMGVEEAQIVAEMAETLIDGDLVEALEPGCEDTDGYQTLLAAMRELQQKYGIAFLYTLYTDGEKVYYGVDTDSSDAQCAVGDEFESSYEEMSDVFAGESYIQDYIDHTEDGDLISAYRPIRNHAGTVVGAVGCDYDACGVIARLRASIIQTVTVSVFCMLIALILLGLIVKKIMTSLNLVGQKIHDIVHSSEGDLSQRIEIHTGDELETIGNDVNLLLDNIFQQAEIAHKVSEGNLTVQVVPHSEKDLLGNSLKSLVESNRFSLKHIHDAAKQVKAGSGEMASASSVLAEGSTAQASAIQEIAASIREVADGTEQNAQNARRTAGLVMQAVRNVKQGNAEMAKMIQAMHEINEASENISKIMKSIDDIAFQTNILSLNASVEAARAGEHGKGFSVVAEEVRSLAVKCAGAAAETSTMIEDAIQKIHVGSQIADDTSSSLTVITKDVEESGRMIGEIAKASDQQAAAVVEINHALEQVSHVVQTNSATSEECAATSAELSNQVERMEEALAAYQLE